MRLSRRGYRASGATSPARVFVTREEIEANKKIGWYEDGGVVLQVLVTKPRRLRYIGELLLTPRPSKHLSSNLPKERENV